MAGEPADRQLPRDELERMVGLVRSDWRVREAAPADGGVTPVYHLRVAGPAGERSLVAPLID